MNKSKIAIVADAFLGKIASVIGYFFAVILALLTLGMILDDPSDPENIIMLIVVYILMMPISISCILKGIRTKKRIKRYKHYVSLMSVQHITSLSEIASITSKPVDFVRTDLQKMIDKKFFVNAYIDFNDNKIVIAHSKPAETIKSGALEIEYEVFTCSGCGATDSKPIGILYNCEYCGLVVK